MTWWPIQVGHGWPTCCFTGARRHSFPRSHLAKLFGTPKGTETRQQSPPNHQLVTVPYSQATSEKHKTQKHHPAGPMAAVTSPRFWLGNFPIFWSSTMRVSSFLDTISSSPSKESDFGCWCLGSGNGSGNCLFDPFWSIESLNQFRTSGFGMALRWVSAASETAMYQGYQGSKVNSKRCGIHCRIIEIHVHSTNITTSLG